MAQAKPIQTATISPTLASDKSALNPSATRYGWCPFKDISTLDMGVVHYRVQPEGSPFYRNLPRCELIPFVTFDYEIFERDPDVKSSPSNPNPIRIVPHTKYALDAAADVANDYSKWGFVVIRAFQGLPQETAGRIFRVIQPFGYNLDEIESEIGAEAEYRIESFDDFLFDIGEAEPYTVEALRDDTEREIARRAALEMFSGVSVAVNKANETLDATTTSMTTRFAGGQGKTTPDSLDRFLADQMNKDLPRITNNKTVETNTEINNKIDYLVGKEKSREVEEENARLRARLTELEARDTAIAQNTNIPEITAAVQCAAVKANGEQCKAGAKAGGEFCHAHSSRE